MEAKRCYGCMRVKTCSPVCEHCGFDERIPNAPHQLPAGTILRGQYLVGKVLGQGGFGITYLGRDINLDTPIAIKEYFPNGMVVRENNHTVSVVTGEQDSSFAENRSRFLREAQTLARLEDVPEVVQVKNFFAEHNTAYIIMGYVKGITLKEYMRRQGGKLTVEETFHLLRPLMEALEQVHKLGLVHRDISPDNIMLQPNRRVRLIDFGAAHAATGKNDKSTQAVLKHGFAPIEQYQSKGYLGPWTDVYAMCATIYCCLTDSQPPNATDRVMGEEDFDWDRIPGLTASQRETLKQGVALQYGQRIQSMQELCHRLFGKEEYVTAEQPVVLQPEPEPELPVTLPVRREDDIKIGTVALVRSAEAPKQEEAYYTAPVEQPVYTAPVERPAYVAPEEQPIYTAPVEQAAYTAPVERPAYTAPVEFPQKAEETQPVLPEEKAETVPSTVPVNPPEKSKSFLKKKWLLMIASVLVLLAIVVAVKVSGNIMVPISSGSRVLMVHDVSEFAFRTKVKRADVLSITFLDTAEAPRKAVDVSESRDGSVVAWTEKRRGGYDLYLAADGDIMLPEDCSCLFYLFHNIEELDVSGFDTSNVTDMCSMFAQCTSLEELDVSGFDTSNVTDMRGMFAFCPSLEALDVSGFDTSNVTDMSSMFYDCRNLRILNVSGFDTSNVTNMDSMFGYCTNLARLNVSGFDTSNVTNMNSMFYWCEKLARLDVSGFDTSKVTNMGRMFCACTNLTGLNVSGFDTSNVTDMGSMFYDTPMISNISGNFDISSVRDRGYFMDTGDTFNGRTWETLFQ